MRNVSDTPAHPARSTTAWVLLFALLLAVAGLIVICVTVVGGASLYTELDRGVPGELTSVTSACLNLIVTVASTICVGGLFYAAFLRAHTGRDRLYVDNARDLGVVRVSSAIWAISAVALIAVDAADSNGQPLAKLLQPGALGYLFQASYAPGAWLVAAAAACLVFTAAVFVQRWQATVFLLGAALIGVLAPVVVGQVLVGPNHDFGSDATFLGLPALTIFIGSTVVLISRLRSAATVSDTSLRRYFATSSVCLVIAFCALAVVAIFETAGTGLLSTPTGVMFAIELAVLLALGLLLTYAKRRYRHRGDARTASWSGNGRVIGIACLALMAVYLGVSVAMSRVPPPVFFVPTSISELFFGYNVNSAPTWLTVIVDWRINLLFFVPMVTAMVLYTVGVVRLRRRGDRWPVGRTVAWMLGALVVILTTSSALGPYASASFSAHMAFHMALNMLGPLLLVMGGPITLALRATTGHNATYPAGPHEWINAMLHWSVTKKLYNPLLVFVEFIGSYYLIYFTGIFDWAMRYHWAHQLMNVHFLIVGYLFYSLVVGVDRPPRPLPYIGKLALVLAAMPFHAFFGVIVFTSTTIIGGEFYKYIAIPWMHDLHQDQVLGGGIAWAAGELPLIVVVIALITQWTKQDQREARQLDRHIDQGLDDSYDVYNEMLAQLATRSAPEPSAPAKQHTDVAKQPDKT